MTQGASQFTLVIETENLAAWMAIQNTFAWDKKLQETEPPLWNGVLIQLGQYERWTDGTLMNPFKEIQLSGVNGETYVIGLDKFKDQFENPTWINVVAGTGAPMDGKHLGKLLPTHAPESMCSLDRYFTAFPGCITLWSEEGYDLKVEKIPRPQGHSPNYTYTFTIGKPCTVTISGAGAFSDRSSGSIDRLVIREPADQIEHRQQGGHQTPPQQP